MIFALRYGYCTGRAAIALVGHRRCMKHVVGIEVIGVSNGVTSSRSTGPFSIASSFIGPFAFHRSEPATPLPMRRLVPAAFTKNKDPRESQAEAAMATREAQRDDGTCRG